MPLEALQKFTCTCIFKLWIMVSAIPPVCVHIYVYVCMYTVYTVVSITGECLHTIALKVFT